MGPVLQGPPLLAAGLLPSSQAGLGDAGGQLPEAEGLRMKRLLCTQITGIPRGAGGTWE